ncbi:MAG: M18 family aminopeptidase [Treponema sp.]|nr:M18 family aminopeptidase [Treponema sp.]
MIDELQSGLTSHLIQFIKDSPTAYHGAQTIAKALDAQGAIQLDERQPWQLKSGQMYYVVRSEGSLIAFRCGFKRPAEAGFMVAGAHTDSPGLKARLEKSLTGKGMERAAVELYGSPIISTWLDRPLSLAGRVFIKTQDGKAESRLIHSTEPIGVVPNLAIHLNRDHNKGFEYNAQNHLPVLLSASGSGASEAGAKAPDSGVAEALAADLLHRVTAQLGVPADRIVGSDLYFVDAQGPVRFGPQGELINAYRLDNLLGCHAILEAFLASQSAGHTQVACFFNHEEIGSLSPEGADSAFLRDILGRISALMDKNAEDLYRALAASFSISVDVAQAYHGSYPEKFDESFAPVLNGGPALKVNANLRYATDGEAEARFRLYCDAAGVPCQKFMSRADITPGTTIGPLSAAFTGIKTVDVGAPLLSMHSIRETAGTLDHEMMVQVLKKGFEQLS